MPRVLITYIEQLTSQRTSEMTKVDSHVPIQLLYGIDLSHGE
jgi:hypothetical protein